MSPRDPHENHRTASSLELFFDLVFVIAVGVAAANLHHSLTEDHIEHGVFSFMAVFLAVWWAWMNFTWFATSFDVDDWLYRVLAILQMGGVIVLAAGIGPFFEGHYGTAIIGYVIMRICMASQWFRAGISSREYRTTTFRYGFGIVFAQSLWIAWLFFWSDTAFSPFIFIGIWIVELLVPPPISEQANLTPSHPHHITERYGLFTLVILGEGLLGSANAIIEGLTETEALDRMIAVAVLALFGTACMWWIYF